MTTETDYWCRLALTIDQHGGDALSDVLHDQPNGGLPTDPSAVYVELDTKYRKTLENLRKKKILKPDQWDLLFPSDYQTHIDKFDITLKVLVIKNCTDIFLKKDPKATFVDQMRKLRNDLMHYSNYKFMPENDFDTLWNELSLCLVGLGYTTDISYMKTKILDQNEKTKILELEKEQIEIRDELQSLDTRITEHDDRLTALEKKPKGNEEDKEVDPCKKSASNDAECIITSNYRNNQDDVILDLTSYHPSGIPVKDDRIDKILLLSKQNYVLRISKKYSNIQDIQDIFSSIYNEQIDVPVETTQVKHSLSGKSIIGIYSHTSVERYRETSACVNLKDNMVVADGQSIVVTPDEWAKYCLRYLNCLSHDETDVFTESIEVFTAIGAVQNLVEKFKSIQKRVLPDAFIGGYNPMEHYNFLYDHCDKTTDCFQNFLVVLRQEPFEILCLSMTFSDKVEDLLFEIQKGCRRVELVAKANNNVVKLIASKPSIYNIIVAPLIETVTLNQWCCKHCLVVPKEIYNDDTQMKNYFDDLPKCGVKKRCKENYKKLASSIIGFVATRAENKTICSVTSHDLVQYTRLTNQQRDILLSCDRKSIIQGDYGSGKTILGVFLLKKIVESAKTNTRVSYVLFQKSELLLNKIEMNLNKFFPDERKSGKREWCYTMSSGSTVDILVCSAEDIEDASSTVAKPSSVIRTLQKLYPNDTHHFIFDEYNGEGLDHHEAQRLKQLTVLKEFKESYIVVLVQALEKYRTYDDGKPPINHDKFKYNETGMKVHKKLELAMRNPKQIHKLLTEAKKSISSSDNIFYHNAVENEKHAQSSISSQLLSYNEKTKKKKKKKRKKEKKSINKYDLLRPESTNQNHPGKIISVKNAMTDVETSSSLELKKAQSVFIEHDVDIIASELHDDNVKGDVKTTTKMFYHKSRLGNKIECEKSPVFVSFNWENDSERFSGIFIFFKHHFFKHHETTALFICDDVKHQSIYKRILEFADRKHILLNNSDEDEYVESCKTLKLIVKNLSIICNTRSSSGCEFPNVVVCVHPEEHHLRHHLVENVSRCTSHLTMVCLGNYNPITPDLSNTTLQTLHQTVKHLGDRGLFHYNLLEFDDSLECWDKPSFDEENSKYKINRNSDEFIALCKQSFEPRTIKKNLPTRSELLKKLTDGLPINTQNISDEDSRDDGVAGADEDNDDGKATNVINRKRKRLDDQPFESSAMKKNVPSRSELLKGMTDGLPINTQNISDEDSRDDGVAGADEDNDDGKATNVINRKRKRLDDQPFESSAMKKNVPSSSSDFDSYTEADIKGLILTKNIKKLKSLSSQWPNVLVKKLDYQTPLHWASLYGHADIVKILIDSGANVNVVDSDNRTPLHEASHEGHADVVKILIDSGANVNVVDSYNRTSLQWASHNGYADIVKILIDSGANVNVVDSDNRTPLQWASHKGHADIVKILIDSGANVNVGDRNNETPLQWASYNGCADIVKILIDSGANVHVVDSINGTPLYCASNRGHADVVEILIDSGANVNVVDSKNRTPLHEASCYGHADVVEILIDSGANVNVVDSDNRTPLHDASRRGHADVVAILKKHGAVL